MEKVKGTAMGTCEHCGGSDLVMQQLSQFSDGSLLGIDGVVLHDAVIETRCALCGEVADLVIPDLSGLMAAIAVARVARPRKLAGGEIRFLRKVAEWSAKELAQRLGVRGETVSRWETGAEPIGLPSEKYLRVLIGERLHGRAPGVKCDLDFLSKLEIAALHSADGDDGELHFWFGPLRVRRGTKRAAKQWSPQEAHAA